ncbi:hypothetical protein HK097_005930, partial [Rhizophlyctis rosea]
MDSATALAFTDLTKKKPTQPNPPSDGKRRRMTEPASPPQTPTPPPVISRASTYQLELVGDDPEERLHNLKSRLAAISSKHVVKRVSAPPDFSRTNSAASVIAEIATLEEQKRRGLVLPPKQPAGQFQSTSNVAPEPASTPQNAARPTLQSGVNTEVSSGRTGESEKGK